MLKANNITKSFEEVHVLKGVDINVEKGELVSIIGKSGSGKSTFLHILGTLDAADSGQLYIDQVEVNKLKAKELAQFRNEKIGFVFQFHHLLTEFSALENVCIPGYISKKDRKVVEKKSMELLYYLGLKDRINHRPSELSGGEQQRVAIARALVNNPAIVFADEPTGNLDSQTSQEILELFVNLRDDFNQTFVMVTHDMSLAGLSNRCLTMQDGVFKQ